MHTVGLHRLLLSGVGGSLSAAFELASGSTASESFVVVSAETITVSLTAFPGLAGTNPTPQSFDWGLPFFYGRQVATVSPGSPSRPGARKRTAGPNRSFAAQGWSPRGRGTRSATR